MSTPIQDTSSPALFPLLAESQPPPKEAIRLEPLRPHQIFHFQAAGFLEKALQAPLPHFLQKTETIQALAQKSLRHCIRCKGIFFPLFFAGLNFYQLQEYPPPLKVDSVLKMLREIKKEPVGALIATSRHFLSLVLTKEEILVYNPAQKICVQIADMAALETFLLGDFRLKTVTVTPVSLPERKSTPVPFREEKEGTQPRASQAYLFLDRLENLLRDGKKAVERKDFDLLKQEKRSCHHLFVRHLQTSTEHIFISEWQLFLSCSLETRLESIQKTRADLERHQ